MALSFPKNQLIEPQRRDLQIDYLRAWARVPRELSLHEACNLLLGNKHESLRTYCAFVGVGRSGHSLVGSLINAHPNAVIAHELNALRFVRAGVPRSIVLAMILSRDQHFEKIGRNWTGYDYRVEGTAQGSFDEVLVIGDKKGGGTGKLLESSRDLFSLVRDVMGLDLRVIHHIRHPLDNVATIALRNRIGVHEAIAIFAKRMRAATIGKSQLQTEELLEVHHADLLERPRDEMVRILGFLNLPARKDYLGACAEKIDPNPSRTRHEIDFSASARGELRRQLADMPCMQRYLVDL
jgi:hypothetical protein